MRTIEVCLTPYMTDLFSFQRKTVVIIDILRATSCFVTGLSNGIKSIRTVSTVEECRTWQNKGYVGAAERGGKKIKGFDLGNSPFEYMDKSLRGKRVVATTTNGTLAIEKSAAASEAILASFLNITAVAKYLSKSNNDVILVCAGWEGEVNLEDTVFAGSLIDKLSDVLNPKNDSSILSKNLYQSYKQDLSKRLMKGAHAKRLLNLGLKKDIEYCLQWDVFSCVPIKKGEEFVV